MSGESSGGLSAEGAEVFWANAEKDNSSTEHAAEDQLARWFMR